MNIAIWWEQESWGGVDAHLANLLGAWPAPDRFTIFHNLSNPGVKRIGQTIAQRNVKTIAFPEWRTGHRSFFRKVADYIFLPLRFWWWKREARQILSAQDPFDAIIADNGAYPGAWTCLAALHAAKQLDIGKRVLLIHHSAASFSRGRSFFERTVDRGVQSWATDIVAVSNATRETLVQVRGFDPDRFPIRVIHNGIRIPEQTRQRGALRDRWVTESDETVLGMLGRIEPYKGQEDVLLAMSKLPSDLRANMRLVVVGEGTEDEKARLRNIADRLGLGDRLVFTGYLDGESSEIAQEFDVLIMATKDFEGFGLAAAEAMAVGTPVLATAVGGTIEFMNENNALLVPPQSPGAIAEALERHMRDPESARLRVQAARETIAKFSDIAMAQNFYRLLNS